MNSRETAHRWTLEQAYALVEAQSDDVPGDVDPRTTGDLLCLFTRRYNWYQIPENEFARRADLELIGRIRHEIARATTPHPELTYLDRYLAYRAAFLAQVADITQINTVVPFPAKEKSAPYPTGDRGTQEASL